MSAPGPDTDFRDYLEAYARKKKRSRQEDRQFFESRTADLPELNTPERELATNELSLVVGHTRMTAYTVSSATWEMIMDKQIDLALNKGLDDYRELTIDNSAPRANSG